MSHMDSKITQVTSPSEWISTSKFSTTDPATLFAQDHDVLIELLNLFKCGWFGLICLGRTDCFISIFFSDSFTRLRGLAKRNTGRDYSHV